MQGEIYILLSDGSYQKASSEDLSLRGYQEIPNFLPQKIDDEVGELGIVSLTFSKKNNTTNNSKVKLIKWLRTCCREYYCEENNPVPKQELESSPNLSSTYSKDQYFGLKHMKHVVEGLISLQVHHRLAMVIIGKQIPSLYGTDCTLNKLQQATSPGQISLFHKEYEIKTIGMEQTNLEKVLSLKKSLRDQLIEVENFIADIVYSAEV